MFRLTSELIQERLIPNMVAAGGFVSFEGRVRNENDGQPVVRLEYEAFDSLAVAEGDRIIVEAMALFPILAAECVHRTGLLEVGETAVRIEVAAAHRGPAFDACEFLIDEIKRRIPIWKKEHYLDGTSDWINCRQSDVTASEVKSG
jgi:molybdopterin synthase catalytic subunit